MKYLIWPAFIVLLMMLEVYGFLTILGMFLLCLAVGIAGVPVRKEAIQ